MGKRQKLIIGGADLEGVTTPTPLKRFNRTLTGLNVKENLTSSFFVGCQMYDLETHFDLVNFKAVFQSNSIKFN